MTIGKLEQNSFAQRSGNTAVPSQNRVGIEVRDLREDEKQRLGVERGVVVVRVHEGPGTVAGIQQGDVITTLDHDWIDSDDAFDDKVAELPAGRAIPVRIVRNQNPEFRVLKIEE